MPELEPLRIPADLAEDFVSAMRWHSHEPAGVLLHRLAAAGFAWALDRPRQIIRTMERQGGLSPGPGRSLALGTVLRLPRRARRIGCVLPARAHSRAMRDVAKGREPALTTGPGIHRAHRGAGTSGAHLGPDAGVIWRHPGLGLHAARSGHAERRRSLSFRARGISFISRAVIPARNRAEAGG